MARRRDPSPFGSGEPDRPDFPAWMLTFGGNRMTWAQHVGEGRLKPEFFEMIRTYRFVRIRLVVEAVVLLAGVYLLVGLPPGLPTVGLVVVVLAFVSGLFDVLLVLRLRRRIAEAWQDLSATPE